MAAEKSIEEMIADEKKRHAATLKSLQERKLKKDYVRLIEENKIIKEKYDYLSNLICQFAGVDDVAAATEKIEKYITQRQ